ncbi:MAG: pilin [bacterium]|nr:pilin [bacterium]
MINPFTKFGAIGDTCDPVDPSLLSDFFGFKPWYHYLSGTKDVFDKCVPEAISRGPDGEIMFNDIWLIALALIDDLLKLAALIAIGFVIYGGIEMVLSNGNPEQVNKSRNAIINSVVGLVIAITASGIISFLGNRLGA